MTEPQRLGYLTSTEKASAPYTPYQLLFSTRRHHEHRAATENFRPANKMTRVRIADWGFR
jgi:hypothetical protein